MSGQNIKIPYPSFTIKDGYFFFFNHVNNILYQKNSSGDVTFTYPLLTSLENMPVLSTHYDGTSFWTIQSTSTSNNRVIRRWRLEDFFCKAIEEVSLDSTTTDYYYDIESMSVEAYPSVLASGIGKGNSKIYIDGYMDKISSGSRLTIGPNNSGYYEDVTVTGVLNNGSVGLDFYTFKDFEAGTNVSIVDNIWLFNDYDHKTLQGTLCRYNMVNDSIDYSLSDDDLSNVDASTFYITPSGNYILFVLGTSLRFFNIETKTFDRTLFMDNSTTSNSTIAIKEIEINGDTLFRLQGGFTYYGTYYNPSNYHYQCSPMRSFVDSITMDVYPKIMPSDGMSVVGVNAIVQDQYSEPAQGKIVRFSDDDDQYGFMTISEPLTNNQGLAKSYYKSGTSPKTVTITAYTTQYD
jgi:hypothetical protein